MTPDYESLRLLGWALLVFSLIGFAIAETISLGTGTLLSWVSRHDNERRVLIASIAPTVYIQQSWLIVVIAGLFAVWPWVYAVGLTCLQPLLLPLVLAWLVRPLALLFRNAAPAPWPQKLDRLLSYSSLLAILGLGLIVGNVLKGIPFHIDDEMHIVFLGDIWALINLFSLLVAACCTCLVLFHGALFLQLDPRASFADSCRTVALQTGSAFALLFVLIGLWITRLEGYHISSEILTGIASNPLLKFVKRGEGLWLDNYEHQITLWLLPALALLATLVGIGFNQRRQTYAAFLSSCVALACSVLTTTLTLFPFLLPSNRSLNTSLTIWDASTSQSNLNLFLPLFAIALLLMALLTRWAYRLPNQLSGAGAKASCSRQTD